MLNEDEDIETTEENEEDVETDVTPVEYTEENQGTRFEFKDDKAFEWPEWIKNAKYTLVNSRELFDGLIQEVSKAHIIAFDIETSGLHLFKDIIAGVSVSTIEGTGYYIPLKHVEGVNLPDSYLVELLHYITDSTKKCVMYNAKFDRSFIQEKYNIDINNYFDVMAYSYVYDPVKKSQALKNSGKIYLGLDTVEYDDIFPKKKKKKGQTQEVVDKNFARQDQEKWYKYACQDTDLTLRLYNYLGALLKENAAKHTHLDKLPSIALMESRCVNPVQKMERRGLQLNKQRVDYLYTKLESQMADMCRKIEKTVPKHYIKEDIETFLNSPDQVGKFVYGDTDSGGLGLKAAKLTKGGKNSTDAEAFELLGKLKDIPKKSKSALTSILDYRELAKSFNTYVWNLKQVFNEGDDIAYFGFLSMKTETARFAGSGGGKGSHYCGINIQAYPKNENARIIMSKRLTEPLSNPAPFSSRDLSYKDLFIDEKSIKKIIPDFDVKKPIIDYYGNKHCLIKSCSGCEVSKWCTYTHELIDISEVDPKVVNYRAVYKARPGFKIGAFDYANEELRIAANISEEDSWIKAFNEDRDLHMEMAIKLFKLPPDAKKDDYGGHRGTAKSINFAIPYGGGPNRIATAAGIDKKEAEKILEEYKKEVPKVFKWISRQHASVKVIKGAKTAFGRFRPLPGIDSENKKLAGHSERQATNTPIQGTASDIMKLTMIQLDKEIKARGYQDDLYILLTVHDELVFEMRETKLDELTKVVVDTMTFSVEKLAKIGLNWKVPIIADGEIGDSWGIKVSSDKYQNIWEEVTKIEHDLRFIKEGKEIPTVVALPEVGKTLENPETILVEKDLPKQVVETSGITGSLVHPKVEVEKPEVINGHKTDIGHIIYDELQFGKLTENAILYDINALEVFDGEDEKVEIVLHALKDPKSRGDKEVIFTYVMEDIKYAIHTGIKVKNEQTVRLAISKAKNSY